MLELMGKIKELLEDKKAENVEIIDVSNSDYFVDGVVLATVMAGKHAFSLAEHLRENLKPLGERFLHIDSSDDWTIIDLGDIIVHLMSVEYRQKYKMEEFLSSFKSKKLGG